MCHNGIHSDGFIECNIVLLYILYNSNNCFRSATSKVGVNMIAARINQEHEKENLAAFALHPGVVETDMVSSPLSVSPFSILCVTC
jgi:hypothetical protein